MNEWNKISLYQFQQINIIAEKKGITDEDKLLLQACSYYDLMPAELSELGLVKIAKLIKDLTKILTSEFKPMAYERVGEYFVNYHPEDMSFGQYVEIVFFLSQGLFDNAHKILSSITNVEGKKNNSDEHTIKSEYFLLKSVSETLGCVKYFKTRFEQFNERYKPLFGTDGGEEIESDPFFKRFGWIYSATQVAEHNKITLDEAYTLPVTQAFNDLAYLKSKANFDERQMKKIK